MRSSANKRNGLNTSLNMGKPSDGEMLTNLDLRRQSPLSRHAIAKEI